MIGIVLKEVFIFIVIKSFIISIKKVFKSFFWIMFVIVFIKSFIVCIFCNIFLNLLVINIIKVINVIIFMLLFISEFVFLNLILWFSKIIVNVKKVVKGIELVVNWIINVMIIFIKVK